MTIGGQDPLTLLVVASLSFLAAGVKTVLIYMKGTTQSPKRLDFICNLILSFFIGILASFACVHFDVSDDLMYIIVAVSALSAERLLSALPTIFVKKVEKIVGVEPTNEDYEQDPINKKNN